MRMTALVWLVGALFAGAAAEAETRDYRLVHGSWTSNVLHNWTFHHQGTAQTVASACMAEAQVADLTLRVVDIEGKKLVTQLESPNWSFQPGVSTLRILWGGRVNINYGDAEYAGNMIVQQSADNLVKSILTYLDAMKPRGPVTVFDDQNRAIAEFPVEGLMPVLADLQVCAGRK